MNLRIVLTVRNKLCDLNLTGTADLDALVARVNSAAKPPTD